MSTLSIANRLVISAVCTCAAMGAASPLRAQGAEPAATSIGEVVSNIVSRAYDGIRLTPQQRQAASNVITASLKEGLAIRAQTPDFRERQDAIVQKRFAALRALLTTDADRARFDLNRRSM